MLRLALCAAALAASAGCAPATAPTLPDGGQARRIVSLNLCTDQYLLALADDAQIAGLTRNATDPTMSAAAERARGLPLLRPSAEEVLAIDPDLLVGMGARNGAIVGALGGDRYPLLDLPFTNSYADIVAQVRAVAAAIGHPARGDALVARMDADLARIGAAGRGRVSAHYQRRGFMTGTGTLVDELMHRAGLINLAGRLGKPALSQLSLEELVAARPDVLIVDSTASGPADQGSEMLVHPALADIPRIHVPEAWTVCGGPAIVHAARTIADQLERLDRDRARQSAGGVTG